MVVTGHEEIHISVLVTEQIASNSKLLWVQLYAVVTGYEGIHIVFQVTDQVAPGVI
jgi:hypothetical protein